MPPGKAVSVCNGGSCTLTEQLHHLHHHHHHRHHHHHHHHHHRHCHHHHHHHHHRRRHRHHHHIIIITLLLSYLIHIIVTPVTIGLPVSYPESPPYNYHLPTSYNKQLRVPSCRHRFLTPLSSLSFCGSCGLSVFGPVQSSFPGEEASCPSCARLLLRLPVLFSVALAVRSANSCCCCC